MIPQQAAWSSLGVGSYMRDRDGVTWKVIARRADGHLGVQNRAGKKVILKPKLDPQNTPVTVLVPSIDEAADLVTDVLGGRLVAERDEIGPWTAPHFASQTDDDQRAHLSLVHGIDPTNISRLLLVAQHERLHADDQLGVNHHHQEAP